MKLGYTTNAIADNNLSMVDDCYIPQTELATQMLSVWRM